MPYFLENMCIFAHVLIFLCKKNNFINIKKHKKRTERNGKEHKSLYSYR